ncbi:hypothetical protein LINGRAHAP2_LOCUS28998, partial [Linum grandiflorum]
MLVLVLQFHDLHVNRLWEAHEGGGRKHQSPEKSYGMKEGNMDPAG